MIRHTVNALVCATLLALLGTTLLAWSRRIDERASARYDQTLRSLLALDSRLTAEVMKARAGLVGHYDGIVQTMAARRRLQAALNELPEGLWPGAAKDIRARLREGQRKRLESEVLVEGFKRENAVLRSSLRYLPVLAEELETNSRLQDARTEIGALVRDELLLQSWQDSALSARIDRALVHLSLLAGAARGAAVEVRASPREQNHEALESELTTLLSHARVVRERTPVVQELTRQIVSADNAGWTERMLATFLARHRAAQKVSDLDLGVSFTLALMFLASAAASIILAQQRSAAALRSTGKQLVRAVDSLRSEQAKQKELSELKSRFVSMASHEFRTPLSVIVSSSELLEAYGPRWPDAKKGEHFVRIRQATTSMTRMLDDILTIGRHNAGALRFEPQKLPIAGFCAQVVEAVGAASGQATRIVYNGPAEREQVMADPVLLRHVLENLLSNALKYSPDGEHVELAVVREEDALRLDVSDHGIGISEEDQQHLFETFHRGKNVGEISGTGLGLAIVQGAVELHGGQVTVHSQLGAGTQFTVRIPCTRSEL
jgi:signal transduction histidine kinase